jgi:hypothetical protein
MFRSRPKLLSNLGPFSSFFHIDIKDDQILLHSPISTLSFRVHEVKPSLSAMLGTSDLCASMYNLVYGPCNFSPLVGGIIDYHGFQHVVFNLTPWFFAGFWRNVLNWDLVEGQRGKCCDFNGVH